MVTNHADAGMLPSLRIQDDVGISLRRWLMLGAAGLALVVLAIMHSAAVGAQSGYPPNTVVSTYVDPRYCDGLVSIVTDQYGNLIDVCTTTGQRIYPVFPDYGYATPGYAVPAYVNNNFYASGFSNGFYNFPAYLGANNVCPSGNFSCYAAYPFAGYAGYTGYAFPYGYTGTYSGQTTIVVPSKNITVVGPPVYVKEATPSAATSVTTAAPAAPAAAPVQAAPVQAAPGADMATAMNAPAAPASAGIVTARSAPPATAPGVQIDPSDQR